MLNRLLPPFKLFNAFRHPYLIRTITGTSPKHTKTPPPQPVAAGGLYIGSVPVRWLSWPRSTAQSARTGHTYQNVLQLLERTTR